MRLSRYHKTFRNQNKTLTRQRKGLAQIFSLVLVLTITLLVTATQVLVTHQLRATLNERYYERALQMAEAGVNAYINQLMNGNGTGTSAGLVPPLYQLPNDFPITNQAFKTRSRQNQLPTNKFIYYPAGQTKQGYFVGHLASSTSRQYTIVAYGWCNGIVRRLKVRADALSVFDWGAIYGLNPAPSSGANDYAWKFNGSASIIGAAGGEGKIIYGNNNNFYDGPIQLAGPDARFDSGTDPTVIASGNNVPYGHPNTSDHVHSVASPAILRLGASVGFLTADQVANKLVAGNTLGVEYYRTNNHNATGLRYLVQQNGNGNIRELTGSYKVIVGDNGTPTNYNDDDWQLDGEFQPKKSTLTALGMANNESFYGIRAYPGNYFFESVSMTNADRLTLRTFTDAERSTITGRIFTVQGDPVNPNSGQATNKRVRFWIGHVRSGNDAASTYDTNTIMEYTKYASRFRIYQSSSGTTKVRGRNDSPPRPFRVNMLVYGRDSSGNGYGDIQFDSSTYVFGCLIGWMVSAGGSTIIEKETPEIGPDDDLTEAAATVITYKMKEWTELP